MRKPDGFVWSSAEEARERFCRWLAPENLSALQLGHATIEAGRITSHRPYFDQMEFLV
jgi:hypothetical protein